MGCCCKCHCLCDYYCGADLGIVTMIRKENKPTFCCDYHKEFWNKQHEDLWDLGRLDYARKYGRELFEDVERWNDIDKMLREALLEKYYVKYLFRAYT